MTGTATPGPDGWKATGDRAAVVSGVPRDGRVPQPSIEGLAAIGRWMRVNGDAIYGSRASLIDSPDCRTTTQARRVNVFVERWRPGDLLLPGLRGAPQRAWPMIDQRQTLPARVTGDGVVLTLPDRPPDSICSVLRVDFADMPFVESRTL